jgi:hypothetical protein
METVIFNHASPLKALIEGRYECCLCRSGVSIVISPQNTYSVLLSFLLFSFVLLCSVIFCFILFYSSPSPSPPPSSSCSLNVCMHAYMHVRMYACTMWVHRYICVFSMNSLFKYPDIVKASLPLMNGGVLTLWNTITKKSCAYNATVGHGAILYWSWEAPGC